MVPFGGGGGQKSAPAPARTGVGCERGGPAGNLQLRSVVVDSCDQEGDTEWSRLRERAVVSASVFACVRKRGKRMRTIEASSSLAPSPNRSARSDTDWVTDSTLIGSS